MKPTRSALAARLAARIRSIGLDDVSDARTEMLIDLLLALALERQNLTSVRDPATGIDLHLVDSLVGLTHPRLAAGSVRVVDVGSGAGFPGLVLAITRPSLDVTLVESERRKAQWLERASARFSNVRVVNDRAECLAQTEPARADVVTARAVAPLPALVELAAPLLAPGGALVAWRGRRDVSEEARAASVASMIGMSEGVVRPVEPIPGRERHLHEFVRTGPIDPRLPRRPGRAQHRPLA